jgi:fructose/tagatose bisphosphate aldolase
MICENAAKLKEAISGVLSVTGDGVSVVDLAGLRESLIDDLIYTSVFSPDEDVKKMARWLIRRAAAAVGIFSSSIHSLYEAMGKKEVGGFTVPAINIRSLTYDVSQAILRAAMNHRVGPVIFEIARSEIDYTCQRPEEYTCAVTAAAVKSGYRGPLFLQGDHFQVSAGRYAKDPDKEIQGVKDLIWEAIDGGFYNIDIDSSTLVNLAKPNVREQQRLNFTIAAELTTVIRDLEPPGVTISIGGEIGEVGGKNSTVEELRAYMGGYLDELAKHGPELKGISKISVQTGTTHGGVPLPDGTIAKVKLDFDTLACISEAARSDYGLAGAVQHGASTLPEEAFDRFPAVGTAEVHLATGFQNMIYESENFPKKTRDKIYDYLRRELQGERKEGDTDDQFIYKTRKKGFGPHKRELWEISAVNRRALGEEMERQFVFLFEKLNVVNTDDLLRHWVKPVDVPLKAPRSLGD